MKHAIITLPIQLWQEIVDGRKLFELRKSILRIHPFSSRVYVVIKGTTIVLGYFTLSGIVGSDDTDYLWDYCADSLRISKDWYQCYASTMHHCLYAWEIDCVYIYDFPVDIRHDFDIQHNPQSFVYTNAEPCTEARIVRGEEHEQSFLDRNEDMPISIYYRGSWYDNLPLKINDKSEPEKAVQ